ncbi:MAG: ankyrin repeat domain-containing protein, partial [Pseudomonadota bacterium]
GQTPLSMAAYQGAANIVALLLDYGSNPNQTDFTGKSALDWARLRQSNQRTVELLQEAVAQSGQP